MGFFFPDLKFDIKKRCISMFNVASQPSALSKICCLRCKYRLQLCLILPVLYFWIGYVECRQNNRNIAFLTESTGAGEGGGVTKLDLLCESALIRVCGCLCVT